MRASCVFNGARRRVDVPPSPHTHMPWLLFLFLLLLLLLLHHLLLLFRDLLYCVRTRY